MVVQHNLTAMNANRQLGITTGQQAKSSEKLSSGYRINRAGDDAAGLAISEKMRAQITGLETAQKNANDGISLVQTAEGALTEVHSMLNRMVELATQSANGTYDNNVDRENLQKELDSLLDEVDRISEATNFNGINLLDGSLGGAKVTSTQGTVGTTALTPTAKGSINTPTITFSAGSDTAKASIEFDVAGLGINGAAETGGNNGKATFTFGNYNLTIDVPKAGYTDAQAVGTALNGKTITIKTKRLQSRKANTYINFSTLQRYKYKAVYAESHFAFTNQG